MGRVRPALPALRRQEVHETGGDSVVKEDRSLTVNIYYAPPIFEVKYVDPLLDNPSHSDSVAYGETTVISTPDELGWSHEGYDFDGWTADPATTEYIKDPGNTITVTSNVTYTANWTKNSYTVKYVDPTCGNSDVTESVAYNDKTVIKTPGHLSWTHEGYAFAGWTPAPATLEYLKDAGNEITITSDVTFTARWERIVYRVVYEYDGSVPEGADALPTDGTAYHLGDDVPVQPKPTVPEGYTFTGWLLGESETTGFTIGTATPVTGAASPYTITLTGRWQREGEVSIIYTSGVPENEIDNDSLRNTKTDSCLVGRDYTVKPNAGWTDYVRSGYTFKGWQVKESASPSPSATPGRFFAASGDNAPLRKAVSGFFAEGSVISGISENVTFEAVWEVNSSPDPEPTYRVTYDGNGSTGGSVPVDATAYKDGETVTVQEKGDLVKAGSSFVGWNTARNGSGTSYAPGKTFRIDGSDVTLYAIWQADGSSPGGTSPGTGESIALITLAAFAMAGSAAAVCGVMLRSRRRRDERVR